MVEQLREWWRERNARERWLIGSGVAVLVVSALWAYVWAPIASERARLIASLPALRVQAQQMGQQAAEVERLRTAARSRTQSEAPQRAIEEAMKAGGFAEGFAGVAALGGGRFQVNLGVVPFDALLRVVAQLAETHGLAVETMALKSTDEPGRVRVESLVLQGARSG
ncbi:MAG TPA: type II secretion system protein M [Burkholderiales bacterium]|nr:type II secretion system protein M [Burkholderiales bacterium]